MEILRDDPTLGLAQGNGPAPPGILPISTTIIGIYKWFGYGTNFEGAWTGDVLFLVTLLFVDDSYLMHMLEENSTDEAFLRMVQDAIPDCGGLVQAIWGSLKPSNHFWYMILWYCVRGQLYLKPMSKLPTNLVKVTQPNGSRAPFPLKEDNHTEKKLGMWCCPAGYSRVYIRWNRKASSGLSEY